MFGKKNLKSENQKQESLYRLLPLLDRQSQPQVYKVKNGKAVLNNITIAKK